jgi:hypothetical protein
LVDMKPSVFLTSSTTNSAIVGRRPVTAFQLVAVLEKMD